MYRIVQIAVIVVGIAAAYGIGKLLEQVVESMPLRWGLMVVLIAGLVTLAELCLKALSNSQRSDVNK